MKKIGFIIILIIVIVGVIFGVKFLTKKKDT